MSDLIKQIEELNLRCDSSTLLPVILQVEQLLKERDEARREVSELKANEASRLASAVRLKGWICYEVEEETP